MAATAPASLARLGRFITKELRETLRDRRTILTLVLMPVLVYPLLGITFQKFFVAQFATQEPHEFQLAFETQSAALQFRDAFSRGNQLLGRELRPGVPAPRAAGEPPDPTLNFLYPDGNGTLSLEETVNNHQADLGVRVLPAERGAPREFELIERQGSVLGREAREHIVSRLRAVNDAFVDDYLGRQADVSLPFGWNSTQLDSPAQSDFSLATLVPLVLILMTVTGAVYPAIDLTAGERERGTLEALVAAPISARQILVAKYVAVVCVAWLTAMVNVTAMVATAYGTGLEQTLFGSAGLSWTLLAQIVGLLTIFASFFSAVILAITSVARSFKEAQAYLIPVMLLSLSPGVLALMPGLEMTVPLALTPLINIVVLTRDLLDGRVQTMLTLLVLASSLGYAALALSIAARIFGTDAVLYGSPGTWSDLWQRPYTARSTPTLTHGLIALGAVVPAYILAGGIPARLPELSLTARLGVSALITVTLFAIWPLGLSIYTRLTLPAGLGLNRASPMAWAGAVLAGLSLWPFAYELEIATIPLERLQKLVEMFGDLGLGLEEVPWWWRVLALAIVPAVCEELFFRGYLLRAFRSASGPVMSVLITAACFGLFHVMVRDALLMERFLPTALMGLVLGWVALKSGSTLPGMLLHAIHNSTLLLIPTWSAWLNSRETLESRSHLPASWLMLAGATVLVAFVLLQFSGRRWVQDSLPAEG